MVGAKEFLSFFGEFKHYFMLFSAIFSMKSLKNERITITHVYFSALTLAVSGNNFLEPWQMLMHEKTCMIPIL